MNTLTGANVRLGFYELLIELIFVQVLLGLGAGVHTCYGLTVGEICPNKYKFLGVAICVVSSVITTGFGAYLGKARQAALRRQVLKYLGTMLTHTANWRSYHHDTI
jgi:hypothetical protein